MLYPLARFFCIIFCKLLFGLKATGCAQVPQKGGFILAGNHASYLDPVIFGSACPRQLNFLARDTLFHNRFFGRLIRSVHSIPLKRNSADLGAMKEALRRLKEGQGLLLFPEGTRTTTGELGQGHHGVGFLARRAGVPVVPVYAQGTFEAWPKGAKSIKPVSISVVFGPAISCDEIKALSDQEIADKIMGRIQRLKDSLG